VLGPPPDQTEGTWFSAALDSAIYRCQWHRIELDLAGLPAGTRLVVSTYSANEPHTEADVRGLPDYLWETSAPLTGAMQPPPAAPVRQGPPPPPAAVVADGPEFLVRSGAGRYLWLRVQLWGDGYGTPAVRGIRVEYPRDSYLSYLPAVFAADEEGRDFLERFLAIFQTEWDALEAQIADIAGLFDPAAVPGGPFLAYLARWLALPLEGTWSDAQKRNLLQAAPRLAAIRGTAAGLRDYLRVYLQNISGWTAQQQGDYPQIIEGFRARQRLQLGAPASAPLGGGGAPLWGPGAVGRLQLDVFARAGEVRLVSTGDPARDLFHEFAHRFRVFVPAAWVPTAEAERMVRRALDAEKPAHTSYDLCLVEPRLRVGLQSTVGLDTVVGGLPVARLHCPHAKLTAAPGLAPRHALGYDMILTRRETEAPVLQVGRNLRVGIDTTLT
jgi:phage tail-like protein